MNLPPRWPDQLSKLVICIGAQKAATSFLFDQLKSDFRIVTPPRKEVHFWDSQAGAADASIWLKRSRAQHRRMTWKMPLKVLVSPKKAMADLTNARQMVRIRTQGDDAYRAYFEALLPHTPDQVLAFEATPSYALLDVSTLRQMAAFHPNTILVFMVRDPVERIWSNISYGMRHDIKSGLVTQSDVVRNFEDALGNPRDVARKHSDYPAVLERLEQAELGSRTHVLFMETLHTATERAVLSEILGFEPTLDFNRTVNKNAAKLDLPSGLREQAMEVLEPVYKEMRERYPDRIPSSWGR